MESRDKLSSYHYHDAALNDAHGYILPFLLKLLDSLNLATGQRRIFDLGCGNGSVANELTCRGFDVTGVDPSEEGIAQANKTYPDLKLYKASAYDDLAGRFGHFPVVVSLEVVEHVYSPRKFASTVYDLLDRDGLAIISTPYHGYLKNLALSLTGKMDSHFTALWDHGHIKFWSFKTLRLLLEETGFQDIEFHRAGRIPVFAKSMIAVARKKVS